ncbi:MAG: outer membrane lipoprotein-sorting protein [bacterium]
MKTKVFLIVLMFMVFSTSFLAQNITADEIMKNMLESYEKQMKGIKDFTIISEVVEGEVDSGSTEIEYSKKAEINGKTVYKRREEMSDSDDITIYDGEYEWEWHVGEGVTKNKIDHDPVSFISRENLKKIDAEFIGSEVIAGEKTYVIRINNMIDFMSFSPEEKEMMKSVKAKGWIDTDDWVIRKIEMFMEGDRGSMKIVMSLSDYRNIDGMLVPFKETSETTTELSPEMIQKQLQQIPEQYRKQAEEQMEAQMGKKQISVTKVKEVKVNTGLSDDLFKGSELGM